MFCYSEEEKSCLISDHLVSSGQDFTEDPDEPFKKCYTNFFGCIYDGNAFKTGEILNEALCGTCNGVDFVLPTPEGTRYKLPWIW